MRLFTKYTRMNLVATIFIFLVSSVAFYMALRYVVIKQVDQDLEIEEKEILTFVEEHNQLPENISVNDQLIRYQKIPHAVERQFSMVSLWEAGEGENEKFRQLVFSIRAAGQWYRVAVSKSLEETETLTRSVLYIAFVTILLILGMTFILNRIVLKRIWKPFHYSLNAASNFKIDKGEELNLPGSDINEFELMNRTIQKITKRARLDYLSLKTFSENASHEIQTPLAVIRSKLDLLLQDEKLTESQSNNLQAAFQSIQKLSKLNQSLMLLAKIENNQFHEVRTIDLKNKVEEKLVEFQELWTIRHLNVSSHLNSAPVVMNEELADILLSNLLSNATKHNFENGKVSVLLTKGNLSITNTGQERPLNPKTLYQRFAKSNNYNGNGLGLSIIKEICDHSGLKIRYEFQEGFHTFNCEW